MFWTRQEEAFFDIRVTYLKAQLLTAADISAQLVNNEREKNASTTQQIINIDRDAMFLPHSFLNNRYDQKRVPAFLEDPVQPESSVEQRYSTFDRHEQYPLQTELLHP